MPFKAYMMEESLKDAAAAAEDAEDCDTQVEAYEDAVYDIKLLSEDVQKIYGEASPVEYGD
jgi:hypothetical protein